MIPGIQLVICARVLAWQSVGTGEITMLPASYRVAQVQKTLRRFEADVPLLNLRVRDLSAERQQSARQFAEALIDQTRAELDRLLKEHPAPMLQPGEHPCEPAD
jgi:hypothetical protein